MATHQSASSTKKASAAPIPESGNIGKFNLKQIEAFRAIMVCGSVSGASRMLHISQPAISRQLAYTEWHLGLKLFERVKGRLLPTPEARRLFVELDALYRNVRRVNDMVGNMARAREGRLSIACSPSLGITLLPKILALFHQRYPKTLLALRTIVPENLAAAIVDRQVELGIAYMNTAYLNVTTQKICDNHIVAVFPRRHPLAKQKRIRLSELIDEPLIGYGAHIPFGELINSRFIAHGLNPPHPIVEVWQTHVACSLVREGLGVALVDEITLSAKLWEDIVAVPLTEIISVPVTCLSLQNEPLSQAARAFLATLTDYVNQQKQD